MGGKKWEWVGNNGIKWEKMKTILNNRKPDLTRKCLFVTIAHTLK